MRGSWKFCLATVLAMGCAPSATQLIVSVDTDLAIRSELDRVEVSVVVDGVAVETESSVLNDRSTLPLTLSVIPEDPSQLGPILISATGYLGGAVVVERHAEVMLVAGETRVLPLFLLAGCRGVICARAGESCGEGGCGPARVEPSPWTGEPPRLGMDAGSIDAGRPDGALPDASMMRDAPIAVGCTTDAECDDGADCTADSCSAEGICQHVGSDAACDDGNPCTADTCEVGGCLHPPEVGISCDDGMFCNGLDTCGSDGTCSTHAGDPCAGGRCLESSDSCDIVCASRADCPDDTFGAWGSCDYADGCDESAAHTRTARRWSCDATSACVATDTTDTEACTRDTDGTSCGTGSCGSWTCGGYADSCDESGTETRLCSDVVCTAGSCGAVMRPESRPCGRTTTGMGCGATTCGSWSACGGFSDSCDESGTQSRTCTDYACAGGACGTSTRTESQACTRSTTGMSCGTTSCGGWGACGGFSDTCDESGTQSRTCTDYMCSAGTCAAPTRSESQACARSTTGTSCGATTCGAWSTCSYATECATSASQSRTCTDRICSSGSCGSPTRVETNNSCSTRTTDGVACGDPFDCTTERCSAGSCNFVSGGCTGGRQCCFPGCFTICP